MFWSLIQAIGGLMRKHRGGMYCTHHFDSIQPLGWVDCAEFVLRMKIVFTLESTWTYLA